MAESRDENKGADEWARQSIERTLQGKGQIKTDRVKGRLYAKLAHAQTEEGVELNTTGEQNYLLNETSMAESQGNTRSRAELSQVERDAIIGAKLAGGDRNDIAAQYGTDARTVSELTSEYNRSERKRTEKEGKEVKRTRAPRTPREKQEKVQEPKVGGGKGGYRLEVQGLYDLGEPSDVEELLSGLDPETHQRIEKGGRKFIVKMKRVALALTFGLGSMLGGNHGKTPDTYTAADGVVAQYNEVAAQESQITQAPDYPVQNNSGKVNNRRGRL